MRMFATRHLQQHLGAPAAAPATPDPGPVRLPAATVTAVEDLVGRDNVAEFIAAATDARFRPGRWTH